LDLAEVVREPANTTGQSEVAFLLSGTQGNSLRELMHDEVIALSLRVM
jgi:hypothetical protein